MAVVLDSSAALAWVLPGQSSQSSDEALGRVHREGAVVPMVWHIEVANILGLKRRSGYMTESEVKECVAFLAKLEIVTDYDETVFNLATALQLMAKYRAAAYDSIYLELAGRRGLPLATFDKEMREAARQQGILLANRI